MEVKRLGNLQTCLPSSSNSEAYPQFLQWNVLSDEFIIRICWLRILTGILGNPQNSLWVFISILSKQDWQYCPFHLIGLFIHLLDYSLKNHCKVVCYASRNKSKSNPSGVTAEDHWLMLEITSVHWIFLALHPQLATFHFLAHCGWWATSLGLTEWYLVLPSCWKL